MLERETFLYSFMLGLCRQLTADIDDADLAAQPVAGMNHPAWILGHIAVTNDGAAKILGEPAACPPEWGPLFGPGSPLSPQRSDYPSKGELLSALETGHERVLRGAAQVSQRRLAIPNTAVLSDVFPTLGDLVSHLMVTHPTLHLGQLTVWRRCRGLPSVIKL